MDVAYVYPATLAMPLMVFIGLCIYGYLMRRKGA